MSAELRSGSARPLGLGRLARLVADPADGDDDLGVLGISLDLGAQPLDVDVDDEGVLHDIDGPDDYTRVVRTS